MNTDIYGWIVATIALVVLMFVLYIEINFYCDSQKNNNNEEFIL